MDRHDIGDTRPRLTLGSETNHELVPFGKRSPATPKASSDETNSLGGDDDVLMRIALTAGPGTEVDRLVYLKPEFGV